MYESHFGLSGSPFGLNPDPEFYFQSKGHGHALSYLRFGVHQGEGFVVAFRYGAAVLIGLDPAEEEEALALLAGPPAGTREEERIGGAAKRKERTQCSEEVIPTTE